MAIKVCVTPEDGIEICATIDVAADAAARAYTTLVGDGVLTSFTLTHDLDSMDLVPILRGAASGILVDAGDANYPTITSLTPDTARLDFSAAPSVGQYQVSLLAVTPTV